MLLQLSNFLSTCTELEPLLEGALDLVLEQFGLKAGGCIWARPGASISSSSSTGA